MPSWNNLNHLWSTLTEVDTNAIRAQAKAPFRIALLGSDAGAIHALADALRTDPFSGHSHSLPQALWPYPLPVSEGALEEAAAADLALIVLPLRQPDFTPERRAFAALRGENPGQVVVIVHLLAAEDEADLDAARRDWRGAAEVRVDLETSDPLTGDLIPILLDLFPDRHVALAHHLPALRDVVAHRLINEVSVSNAGYAASTGLAEIIPVLTIPFNVADMVVLSKNQALLAYKIALALGKDIGVQEMAAELAGVLGSGFVWRELARRLVGFIPVWGLIPKVAVAYAGTYATGMAVYTWYAYGRKLTPERLRELYAEALEAGKARAAALVPEKRPRLRLPRLSWRRRTLPCPNCQHPVRKTDHFCPNCGFSLELHDIAREATGQSSLIGD